MQRRTLVFLSCSPRPRAGVTTTARLLTDFHLLRQTAVEGFDADPHDRRYADLFPERARVVDISGVKGQIALFDRLLAQEETVKIVDVWHRVYDQFFSTVKDIGFIEEARRQNVELVVLFHVDETETALAHALALTAAFPGLMFVAVHNEGAAPLGENARKVLARYPARGKFFISSLDGALAKTLERPDLSLSGFLTGSGSEMSIVVRAGLKAWLAPIFTQLQTFHLRFDLESAEFLR